MGYIWEARRHSEALGLEVMKRAVGSPVGRRKVSVKTLWRSRPPPKSARNVGEPVTLGSFARTDRKRTNGSKHKAIRTTQL
jgi:hypothetical protein